MRVSAFAAMLLGTTFVVAHQQPIFRSSTVRVNLDVVVTDKDDRPVYNLSREDFQVRQHGVVQPIKEFDRVAVDLNNRAVDLEGPAVPSIDVASNTAAPKNARVFSFVVDEGTIQPQDFIPVKRTMAEFLRRLSPADWCSLTYIARSDLSEGFTNDTARIIRATNRLTAAFGSPARQTTDQSSPVAGGDDLAVVYVLNNVIDAINAAPQTRRAIVLISRGLFPQRLRHRYEWKDMYDKAVRAGVPVYTLDPSGLMAPELGLEGHIEDQTPENRSISINLRRSAQDMLREVATETGGRPFVNEWNVIDSVDQIVSENGAYYVLAFEPEPYSPDGKFHDIEVKVNKPGLKVRAKRGYLATPPHLNSIFESLARGMAGGDLQVSGTIAQLGAASKGLESILAVDVNMPAAAHGESNAPDVIELAWVGLDPDGKMVASGRRDLSAPGGVGRLSIVDRLEVPNGAAVLRVAVTSKTLGTQGTIHLPLKFSAPNEPVFVSPIVLGLQGGAPVRLFRLGGSDQLVPFPPTTVRDFEQNQVIHVFCRMADGSPAGDVGMTLVSSSGQSSKVPFQIQPSASVHGSLDLRAAVPLASLPRDSYWLQLQVNRAGSVTRRSVAFRVE